jgi:hypothetical protein
MPYDPIQALLNSGGWPILPSTWPPGPLAAPPAPDPLGWLLGQGEAGPPSPGWSTVDAVPTGSIQLAHNLRGGAPAPMPVSPSPTYDPLSSIRPPAPVSPPPTIHDPTSSIQQAGPVYAPAVPPPRPSDLGAPTSAKKRIDPAKVNLGYYAPTTGNVRGSTWTPYANPNDPRIFKGALSA